MWMKAIFPFIFLFSALALVNTASAGINVTDAEAIYETSLTNMSVPTTPVPVKTIFTHNDEAIFRQNLFNVSIPTQPSPVEDIFIFDEEATFNTNLHAVSVPTVSSPLKEIFIYLEETRAYEDLLFPKDLINDTAPPIITNVSVTNITENSATIKWETDKFANSLVRYGKLSGEYTESEEDPLFVKNHVITLTGLSPGTCYYFVVSSTDRSGNSATSSEYNFTTAGTANYPPTASFTCTPENPLVSQMVIFNASSSYDPDGNITNYEWDFGDGNITSMTEPIITHSYSSAGDYVVILTVTDNDGATNSTSKVISVYPLTAIFDTGAPANPYPSIAGIFNGTITPSQYIKATKLHTYPCVGTGGHTEYAKIWNETWNATAKWNGYIGDWHNITFDKPVVLMPNEKYNITIITGSYPQIHHKKSLKTESGWINCTEFRDANGRKYYDWIPAIALY